MEILSSLKKNSPDLIALFTGKMPQFIYGCKNFKDIPVFCFHSARFPDFEKQLLFLNDNGYKTLDSRELLNRLRDKTYKNNGKEIVLTFDDGMASVWTVAYPLLQKYKQKIISFILPGLIGDKSPSKTIADSCNEQEKVLLINRDFSEQPLCNWSEIKIMHDSGLVDFQSHGLAHRLVAKSNKIVDFIHPQYDTYHYGNIHVPTYYVNNSPTREPVLGHPVYESQPILSLNKRFDDDYQFRTKCSEYVTNNGGIDFFSSHQWREKLSEFAKENAPTLIQYTSVEGEIVKELKESKAIIESKLNKKVTHFCFPWFAASLNSAVYANEAGYDGIHLGSTNGFHINNLNDEVPICITRLQEEYLLALPGYRNFLSVIKYKLRKSANW